MAEKVIELRKTLEAEAAPPVVAIAPKRSRSKLRMVLLVSFR